MNELAEIVSRNEEQIRTEWIREMSGTLQRTDLISKAELEEQCRTLLNAVIAGLRVSGPTDISAAGWIAAREFLQRDFDVSRPPGIFSFRRGNVCSVCQATAFRGHPAEP